MSCLLMPVAFYFSMIIYGAIQSLLMPLAFYFSMIIYGAIQNEIEI